MKLADKIIYQVYPKSFYDTTGNGKGDLRGVIEKLDYIAELGPDLIWLNPFYPSPQKDNGYDISDYTSINPEFGTMEDFEELVLKANQLNIGLMLDMVLNHTSIEHEWFQRALAGEKYYQDFYYLRPAKNDGSLPTNWESKFGGPAWEPFGNTDLFYLHLYDVSQADLNWHNPNVRNEIYKIVNFWLKKGVKGLRFDVLNVIGKDKIFVDSEIPGSDQEKSLYTDTPIVHYWVKELNEKTFGQFDNIITVGEMSSTNIENGIKYSSQNGKELSMIFSFHHLKVDYDSGNKWSNVPFDFINFKKIIDDWQIGMYQGNGWNALFLNNHDQPRSNSRFGDVVNFPYETQTMLATTIQLLRGTPYIYQGEEIGMTNPNYANISEYNDIETINHYKILKDRGLSDKEAIQIIKAKSRDNSRTPMQWNNKVNAGFTFGNPWLKVASNYKEVNVENELNGGRIFSYYKKLIKLRKQLDIIKYGSYKGILLDHPNVMAYVRKYNGQIMVVISHFYSGNIQIKLPKELEYKKYIKLIGNGSAEYNKDIIELSDYETVVFLSKD